MIDLFLGLKRLIKRRIIHIDNCIFRLNWQLTSIILIAFSLVITTRQYVGQPIDCLQKDEIPASVLNTYCWIHSTFTIPSAFSKQVGRDVPHPGIDNSKHDENDKKYYTYYQWVCFALFLQGIFFYVPYYLWKLWEGGLMRAISMGMQIAIISDEEKGHKKRILIDYLLKHMGHHQVYAIKYFACEGLCLVNIILQFWFMNWFFDYKYLSFGFDVLSYMRNRPSNENLESSCVNPMIFVFPRMTKCTFHAYGYSGDIEKHDALCMLPLNVVNEKIYLFIWFWFSFLGFLTLFVIVYRICIVFCPQLRSNCLLVRCRLSDTRDLKIICDRGNIGDWFVLYMLGTNLDPIVMAEITYGMAKRIVLESLKQNNNKLDIEAGHHQQSNTSEQLLSRHHLYSSQETNNRNSHYFNSGVQLPLLNGDNTEVNHANIQVNDYNKSVPVV